MTRRAFARSGQPEASQPLHYMQCGLDDVYLMNGYTRHETPYGGGVSVEDVDGLHHAIARNIIRHKGLLGAKEIRFLRKLMGFTQADLARKLRCDTQSVARWEKGQTEVNGASDLCIRAFYIGRESQDVNLLELADELAGLNITDFPQYFTDTDEGWQAAA